jgi:fructose-specific component phosphotransferase system IIB-like protein
MAFPDYPTLQADTRSLYETDILAQQEALRQKTASEAALKEAAYQNPERTLSQALTQAFVAGIPSLVGALAGGQRGAGYGMQAGGQGAEALGLHYDTEDKENKQLAQNEFANAIRDRQTQENQIELLKQRRNEALLGLTGKQIEEEGQETRSKREHEEKLRQFGIEQKRLADSDRRYERREDRLEGQAGAPAREKKEDALYGLNDRALLREDSIFTPGARDKVNESYTGLQEMNDLLDYSKQAIESMGTASYSKWFDPAADVNILSIQRGLRSAYKKAGEPALIGNPNASEMATVLGSMPLPKELGNDPSKITLMKESLLKQIGIERERTEKMVKHTFGQWGYDYAPRALTPQERMQRNDFGLNMIATRSDRTYRRNTASTPQKSQATDTPTVPPTETRQQKLERLRAKHSAKKD